MSVQAMTVGTLVSRIAFALTNSATADTGLATEIKHHLGYVLHRFVRTAKPTAFIVRTTFNTSASTTTYSLADDMMEMLWPSFRNTTSFSEPITKLDTQTYDSTGLPLYLSGTGRPRFYMPIGNHTTTGVAQVQMLPTPDATYTIAYSYVAAPTPITGSTADGTEIDPRFPRDLVVGLIHAVCTYFPQYLSTSQLQVASQEAQRILGIFMQDADNSGKHVVQQGSYRNTMGTNRQVAWPTSIYTGSPIW